MTKPEKIKAWECRRCKAVHVYNPKECRVCDYTVFNVVRRWKDTRPPVDAPSPIDIGDTVGTAKKAEINHSPDVAPDGSIKNHDSQQDMRGLLGWLKRRFGKDG